MTKIHISKQTKVRLLKIMKSELNKKLGNELLDNLYHKQVSFNSVISKVLDHFDKR